MAPSTARQDGTPGATERRLASLRARIARIGAGRMESPDAPETVAALGCDDIDCHLPGGGLARGAVHEVIAADSAAAALGFALWVVSRMTRGRTPWLWCASRNGSPPYAPGLAQFGLSPRRLLIARTAFERETLWAAEEGLATPALGAVLAEAAAVSDVAARRLALAARTSGVPLILLRERETASVPAASRWRVASAPEGTWEIALLRAGGAFPRRWRLRWQGAAGTPQPLPVPSQAADHHHDDLQADYEARDAAGARAVAGARGAA
jgi:protein ImuA